MTSKLYDRAAVGVYSHRADVEQAVRMLENADIPVENISIIGRDSEVRDAELGHVEPPEFVEHGLERTGVWGGLSAGGVFGLLAGFGTFFLPGIGMLAVLGPMAGLVAGMTVGAIGGEALGELSFQDLAADYRDWLVAGKLLVIVHCRAEEEPRVKQVLESMQALSVTSHSSRLPTSHSSRLPTSNSSQGSLPPGSRH